MIASVFFLALAVQKIPLGTGYAIWTGIGAVGTVILGIVLFAESAAGPLDVGLIAHLRHQPGGAWDVHDTTAGAGALALVDNAVAARWRPDAVLRTAATASASARSVAGVRGEAEAAVAPLLELLR